MQLLLKRACVLHSRALAAKAGGVRNLAHVRLLSPCQA